MSFQSPEFRVLRSSDTKLPSGLQTQADVHGRRYAFVLANVVLNTVAIAVLIGLLLPGEWTKSDTLIALSGFFVFPPVVLSFLNALIGFVLKRSGQAGLRYAAPHIRSQDSTPAISARTAIVLTLRNDPVEEALRRLKLIRASLESTGEGSHFAFFILSDTSDPVLAKREEVLVYEWNKALPDFAPVTYRRRLVNAGYKAGNLADFCRNWGEHFDFLIPLDARSFMTGVAILEMVRVMQASPKIGIVQALAIHAPKASTYARFKAFVARLSDEMSALGEAAWRADCADYTGRNAIVRIAPFYLHCRMPHLSGRAPFGGGVMQHERIEAAFMRRAGYEVRSLPIELDQFEDRPQSVFDDMLETRLTQHALWQLPRFISHKDVPTVYRLSWLMNVIEGFAPIFLTLSVLMLAFKPFDSHDMLGSSTLQYAQWAYLAFLGLNSAPLVLGFIDTLCSRDRIIAFGGLVRLVIGGVLSLALSFVFLPALAFRSCFSLFKSPFIQTGDQPVVMSALTKSIPRSAFKSFWPATLFGVDLMLLMLIGSPPFAIWSLPITLGYLAIIPVVAVMSSVRVARFAIRSGLLGVPEVFDPPREIVQLIARTYAVDYDRAA